MPICPAGHDSAATDFCDQCGAPLTPETASPASAPAGPGETGFSAGDPAGEGSAGAAPVALEAPSACPHCGAAKPAGALFCEACGYDYTTGALPSTSLSTALGLDEPAEAPAPEPADRPEDEAEAAGSATELGDGPSPARDTDGRLDDAPGDSADGASQTDDTPGSASQDAGAGQTDDGQDAGAGQTDDGQDAGARQTDGQPEAEADSQPGSGPGATAGQPHETPGQPADSAPAWVAEVWVDPDWHALQQAGDLLPPEGPPTTYPLASPALIGRRSESRHIHPDVDCGTDAGCSRRQAELSFDSGRWTVTDLGSANGTFVAPASSPLPDRPIEVATPVGADDRIYVGAWTRIVVRPAASGETDALVT